MLTLVLTAALASLPVELSTPSEMLAHGKLSQAEFDSLLKDLSDTLGTKAADGNTLVVSKFAMTLYGFVQANAIYDTTESFTEQAANGLVARPGTYPGTHDRFQLSARHSRFGFRLKAPEFHEVRVSGTFEMDFLGNQLPVGAGQPYFTTESSFVANPSFRARHLFAKIETPFLDVLAGQTWPIFGGQPSGNPNTVEIQGVPNQLYSRMPQFRISKLLKSEVLSTELVLGAVRSPQRDAGLPDAQAAVRIMLNGWKGFATGGATNSSLQPATLTISGDLRSVRLPEFSAAPKTSNSALGGGIAADLLLPIIRATAESRAGALTLVGEFVWGKGTADLYSGLNGGVSFPALPNPTNASPAPTYSQDIDNGIATYDTLGTLHLIQWTTWMANLQYFLPVDDGKIWLSALYTHGWSPSTASFVGPKARKDFDYFSAAIFADLLPGVRVGLEYALTLDRGVDDVLARNHRFNFAAFYLF